MEASAEAGRPCRGPGLAPLSCGGSGLRCCLRRAPPCGEVGDRKSPARDGARAGLGHMWGSPVKHARALGATCARTRDPGGTMLAPAASTGAVWAPACAAECSGAPAHASVGGQTARRAAQRWSPPLLPCSLGSFAQAWRMALSGVCYLVPSHSCAFSPGGPLPVRTAFALQLAPSPAQGTQHAREGQEDQHLPGV